MALSNYFSGNLRNQHGDFTVGGGQMGLLYESNVTASGTLWGLYVADRYVLNPNAGGLELTLPVVSQAAFDNGTGVIHGHEIRLRNVSVNAISIANSGSTQIVDLMPGITARLQASANDANGWRIIEQTSAVAPMYGDTNLQQAYLASATTDPQIQLDAINGGLKIWDAAGFNEDILKLANSDGSVTHFRVGNVTPGLDTASIEMLGGSATSNRALAFGTNTTTSGSGSISFSDGSSVIDNNVTSSALFSFNSFTYTDGGALFGTSNTDSFETTYLGKAENVPVAGAIVNLLADIPANTSLSYTVEILGRETNAAGSLTHGLRERGYISTAAATGTLRRTDTEKTNVPSAGLLQNPGNFVTNYAGGVLSVTITAPDYGVSGAGTEMTYVWKLKISAWTV